MSSVVKFAIVTLLLVDVAVNASPSPGTLRHLNFFFHSQSKLYDLKLSGKMVFFVLGMSGRNFSAMQRLRMKIESCQRMRRAHSLSVHSTWYFTVMHPFQRFFFGWDAYNVFFFPIVSRRIWLSNQDYFSTILHYSNSSFFHRSATATITIRSSGDPLINVAFLE
jgi:hypothetical protein